MPLITRGGVDLHYLDLGSGPAVFFHTGGGGDGTMWQAAGFVDALPGRRCLLFDHRGHGKSGKPENVQAHTIEEYLADAIAVLDAAGVARAVMVGYSDGSQLIFRLASRFPERVAAIVAIGGVAHPDSDAEDWRRKMAAEVRVSGGIRAYIERLASMENEPPPQWFFENLAATSTEMFCLELEGWANAGNECADFPLISAPTLIVCEAMFNTDGAAQLAVKALPRDSAFVELPDSGHLQAFYRTDVTLPIITDFLDKHAPLA